MGRLITSLIVFAVLAAAAGADEEEEVFAPGDHCVAYRTVKDLLFAIDAEIIGRNCDVTASMVAADGATDRRVAVEVPIKSFKSRNFMRDRAVADLLGVKTQPDLRFSSNPIEVEKLRADIARGRFQLPGILTLGGKDFPLEFPLEIFEHEDRHYVKGRLVTTFAAFEVEVPNVAGGLIARPHEALELIVHLDLERVEGLEDWAQAQGLR
jgi:polyisoprenoid-binding protein YceI